MFSTTISHSPINAIAGLENITKNVSRWLKDPTSYSPAEMREYLDNLGSVLFEHLDQEVCFLARPEGYTLINFGVVYLRSRISEETT